jgi:hypothetical protein
MRQMVGGLARYEILQLESRVKTIFTFLVDDQGNLSVEDYAQEQTRLNLFDTHEDSLEGDFDIREVAQESAPLAAFLYQEYVERYDEMSEADKKRFPDPDDTEDDPVWVQVLSASESATLREAIRQWFNEPPDDHEQGYINIPLNGEAFAYEILNDLCEERLNEVDILAELGIDLIDGDHPGSDAQYAVLNSSVEEANRVAQQQKLNLRFKLAEG